MMKTATIALCLAAWLAGAPAWALPAGMSVANGTANPTRTGNALTVVNSANAILDWRTFSIQAGEAVRFVQPSSASAVLNRVTGGDPSAIHGRLSSNGAVWLVNPAGILVGPSGRIDAAAFVASALPVRAEDFLAGRFAFAGAGGDVVNRGAIATPAGGTVYLVGANVANEGTITAPGGEILLAAGRTVELVDTATPGVKVEITGAAGDATNLGGLLAAAGRIGMAGVIVRNAGIVDAGGAVEQGGRIFLKATRDAQVERSGRLLATGGRGGRIEVLGNRVAVTDDALLDASGMTGGGTVLVGGDRRGENPAVPNAAIAYFGPAARIRVDATRVGAGGTAIVWADDSTRAHGRISARGGARGGDGGFIETSGKRALDAAGLRADAGAARGRRGQWLLDPGDIHVVHATSAAAAIAGGIFDPLGSLGTVSDFDINAALAAGTGVTITTASGTGGSGNILVKGSADPGGAVSIDAGNAGASLSLVADGRIDMRQGASIVAGGTASNVSLHAGGDIQLNGRVATAGNVDIRSDGGSIGIARIEGGNVQIQAARAILDNNGAATNIRANGISLLSDLGNAAGLAISADIESGGSLAAHVNSVATLGGISIRSLGGAAPADIALRDGAAAGRISFSHAGDLKLDGAKYFIVDHRGTRTGYGAIDIGAAGTLTVEGAGFPLNIAAPAGGAIKLAGNDIVFNSNLAATVAVSVDAARDILLAAATVSGPSIEFRAGGNIALENGARILAPSVHGDPEITAGGDLRLSNGSYILGGDDIHITLNGAASTLYLNEAAGMAPSYLLAESPNTIHLAFPARATPGVVIDGVATLSSLPGGSGLFVENTRTPATLGDGLEIVLGRDTEEMTRPAANSLVSMVEHADETERESHREYHVERPGPSRHGAHRSDEDTIGGASGTFGGHEAEGRDEEASRHEDDKREKSRRGSAGGKRDDDRQSGKKVAKCM